MTRLIAGVRAEDSGVRGPVSPVFVADLTPEAEGVSRALRAAGHTVVEVPPSMLVARVAVQRPRVVLVDADSEGALEVVERMRELPDADAIHVLFLARAGGAIANPEDALAHEGTGLFVRPIDVPALVQRVGVLASGMRAEGDPSGGRPLTVSAPSAAQTGPSPPPSLPPASMRASIPPAAAESRSSAPPSPRPSKRQSEPPAAAGGGSARRVMSLAPPVSPELQQLLADAEQRVPVQSEHESIVPSPEDEIEAVLPADLLAALDEPLDEDEDDDDPVGAPRSTAAPVFSRERTSIRGGSRAARTTTSGGGRAITGRSSRTAPGLRPSDSPPTPSPGHTQGGTHSGPTGDGISTTGNAEAAERQDASGSSEGTLPPPPRWAAAPGTTRALARDSGSSTRGIDRAFPTVLGPGDAMAAVARAIAERTTASLCLATPEETTAAQSPAARPRVVERRIVLREGDVVTASSTAEDESLLAFLGVRGDLPRETVRRLAPKFPAHGRHAGAALVARGYLRQDQMWPTLRAHAEWLVARALQTPSGRLAFEPQPPGRLGGEPSVFGGSTGAAVFVEIVRRIVPPAEAIERMGGAGSHVGEGPKAVLLAECALDAVDVEQAHVARGQSLRDVLESAPEGDLATVIFALSQIGVLEVLRTQDRDGDDDASAPDVAALDTEAVRERVRARLQIVDDGDYFALLGVPRGATGYEVRRAFLELRRAFDPSRILTPEVVDLADDVRKIAGVLEEAYEILKDAARRERYRRAIEATPDR